MYRISELSSKFFIAFAWCDFILSITHLIFLSSAPQSAAIILYSLLFIF